MFIRQVKQMLKWFPLKLIWLNKKQLKKQKQQQISIF